MTNKYLDKHVLLRNKDIPNIRDINVYIAHGGYDALKKALTVMNPGEVTQVVKTANLRGRGGAGFPAGVKWSFIPPNVKPVYVVVNADESEPGTFKDRELMGENPHQVIEGIILCAFAVGAERAYIYGRGEFKNTFVPLKKAIDEAYNNGLLGKNIMNTDFSMDIFLHLGAGAYICGEETALLNSLEGYMGQPRSRPPFPAAEGLYAKPTVINNVETLSNVPPIILNGSDWYRRYGTERSPGIKIFSLSGHVKNPGNYELPLGAPLRYLIEELGGGTMSGLPIKGILPAGASAPMIPPEHFDVMMDYESMAEANTTLGSASFIVMDETVDMAWAAEKMVHFFKHESCGKCSPCREGNYWLEQVMHRIRSGKGTSFDIDLLTKITHQMTDNCFCPLGEFAVNPINATIKHFRSDYEKYITL
ncbi:MAG: NADH-quinone oxidoreductase subunit F [Anaerolineaceae bacterium 4572_78]|nr:MAG: NADH-quinone oxidoreductase subunit F [Anaerolineaceae bacterium 4572_78]